MRKLLSIILSIFATVAAAITAKAGDKPNIIIIYADDLGYGDLGCYGHPTIRTPNLDRMATEGMRFTEFYSAAEVCTPSRSALLTGRYPVRNGMCHDKFRVLRNNSKGGLPKDEVTLPELLKTQGYATGMVGKWHLGHLSEHLPPHHGFDSYFGMPFSNDMMPAPDAPKGRERFFAEINDYWQTPLIRDTMIIEEHPDQRQLTRRYSEEAVKFIKEKKSSPFFLYVAHSFPHVPLFASENFRGKSPAGIYGDVVEELDWSVGQILDTLRAEGLDEKTLVVFSSDNGPWLIFDDHGGSAGLLKEGKGSTWEGGMRVPGIFWWPKKIPSGSVQREMANTMDVFTTCALLGGATLPATKIDGIDISPLLLGTGSVDRPPFMYYRGATLYACRLGPWKAHFLTQPAYGTPKAESHDPPLLYQVRIDPGERWDRAAMNPEIVSQIKSAVEQHRSELQMAPTQLEETVATAP